MSTQRPPHLGTPPRARRRRSLALAVAATGLLALGCARGSGEQQEPVDFDAESELSGTVTVMGFGATDDVATTRLDEAEQALGTQVEVELVEGELDIQQFLSAVAAGDPPSLVYADRDQIGTFASRGALVPLEECVQAEEVDTAVFDEAALGQVVLDGELYGLPEFSVVQVVQANADLLEAAGLTLDDVNGSDWESLTAANRELARREGRKVSVIGFDSKLPEFLPLWARANGVDLISEDGRTAQLDDPAVVEALEFAVGIYDDQGGFAAVKALRDSADFFGDENQFATGTLGAMPMEQWYVNVLSDVSPDAPLAFDTVRDRDGEPLAWTSGSAWAVPVGSPEPEAACRFAATMTATATWMAAAEARRDAREQEGGPFTGILTANTEADAQIRDLAAAGGSEPWSSAVAAIYEGADHAFAMPANPAGAEFESAWQDAVNRVLNGQQEPQEAMTQAQEEAQEALDEAWAGWDE